HRCSQPTLRRAPSRAGSQRPRIDTANGLRCPRTLDRPNAQKVSCGPVHAQARLPCASDPWPAPAWHPSPPDSFTASLCRRAVWDRRRARQLETSTASLCRESTEAAAAKPTTTRADTVLARALIPPKRPERPRARRRSPPPPCHHLEAATSAP